MNASDINFSLTASLLFDYMDGLVVLNRSSALSYVVERCSEDFTTIEMKQAFYI